MVYGFMFVLLLLLSACLPLSPLPPEAEIGIQGEIIQTEGSPVSGQRVRLDLPLQQSLQTSTDSGGLYRFSLQARQTQLAGLAADLTLAAEDWAGAHLSQSLRVQKSHTHLPQMRFWHGLQSPESGKRLFPDPPPAFAWQAPSEPARYQWMLQDALGEVIWRQEQATLVYSPSPLLFEAHQSYRWSVRAAHLDYDAEAPWRSLQTQHWPFYTVPLQAVTYQDKARASWHDGRYDIHLPDELRFEERQTLTLVLTPQAVSDNLQALYFFAEGFRAELRVQTESEGPVLARAQVLDQPLLLRWPPQPAARVYLTLIPLNGGFIRIREFRLIAGPAS